MKKTELKRYDTYKPSGLEWLGEIPGHWREIRFKFLSNIYNGDSLNDKQKDGFEKGESGITYLSTKDIIPDVHDINYDTGLLIPSSNKFFKKAFPGSILLCIEGGSAGKKIAFLNREVHFVNKLACFRFKGRGMPKFYFFYIQSTTFQNQFKLALSGLIGGVGISFLKNFQTLLPTISEQTAIAQFLDSKTTLIDKAIALKKKQIALLKERRQVIIHQAVTRGLNPDVPMKNSGSDWIGEIPAHWMISKLKYNSTVQSGITLGKSYTNKNLEEVPYLRVANVQAGYFKLEDIACLYLPAKEIDKYLIRDGDILVTEGGDLDKLGRGAVWRNQILKCLHQNHVFAIRINSEKLDPEYVSLLMESDYGRRYFTNTANKTTNLASTNSTKLGNFPLILPPRDERDLVLGFIQKTNNKINSNIRIKQQEIEKLKEYKASLINSAVTGKIKVA